MWVHLQHGVAALRQGCTCTQSSARAAAVALAAHRQHTLAGLNIEGGRRGNSFPPRPLQPQTKRTNSTCSIRKHPRSSLTYCQLPIPGVPDHPAWLRTYTGGPSNAVNVHNAGGSLEASVLLCAVFTPAALITFPYAFHHFVLFLLDQPLVDDASRGADAAAAAAEAELRAHLKAAAGAVGGTVTPAVMAAIRWVGLGKA